MKSKTTSFSIILLVSILLCSCTSFTNNIDSTASEIDPYFPEDKLRYTDIIGDNELAETIFKEELDLKSLSSHIFYYSDGQYNFVVNFDSTVTNIEVDNFMSYFSNSFISMHTPPIGASPYQSQLADIISDRLTSEYNPYEKLSLRVYINDVKAFRSDYGFKDLKLTSYKYWENVYNDYTFKSLKSKSAEDFTNKNSNLGKTVNIRKTFKNDGVILVDVRSNRRYSDRYIDKIKGKIEQNLAPALEKEALDKFNANFQYLGIVLQFKVKENIYKEYTYYNGKNEDKGWIDVNWMDHNFLSNYIQN